MMARQPSLPVLHPLHVKDGEFRARCRFHWMVRFLDVKRSRSYDQRRGQQFVSFTIHRHRWRRPLLTTDFLRYTVPDRSQTVDSRYGEMSEWLKEHAWKAC